MLKNGTKTIVCKSFNSLFCLDVYLFMFRRDKIKVEEKNGNYLNDFPHDLSRRIAGDALNVEEEVTKSLVREALLVPLLL